MRGYQWPHVIQREDGKDCENAEQYFGGPFFDEDGILFTFILNLMCANKFTGKFLHPDLIPERNLADTLPSLESEEREDFLSFVRMMVAWLPEERKMAGELMDHPSLRLK